MAPETSPRERILVVEDSPTMIQLYRMVLGSRPGAELIFAGDGLEALDRVAQEPELSLMIVDINMPKMDGLEFLRRARSELRIEDVPAIVISTEGEDRDRDAASAAGASAYLRKPWSPQALLDLVDRTIAARGGR